LPGSSARKKDLKDNRFLSVAEFGHSVRDGLNVSADDMLVIKGGVSLPSHTAVWQRGCKFRKGILQSLNLMLASKDGFDCNFAHLQNIAATKAKVFGSYQVFVR
jgi:hypothetical protein